MYTIEFVYWKVIDLAKEAGEIQKRAFRTQDFKISTKSSEVDMLTEVDLACDHLITEKLKAWFPNDHILSEELGEQFSTQETSGQSLWIIDPLDGTTNFSIGHPIFAVSIALWKEGVPEFGVVYVPMLDEVYYAQKGYGAYRGSVKLCASKRNLLRESVLATGFPYDRATADNNNSDNVKAMIPLVKGIRRLGAAAYDLSLVAAGVYDAYWELRLGQWDLAAGLLLIREAGGVCEYTVEDGKYNVVAGSELLCQEIKKRVNLKNRD